MDLYSELAWRGMVYDTTEGLPEVLAEQRLDATPGESVPLRWRDLGH